MLDCGNLIDSPSLFIADHYQIDKKWSLWGQQEVKKSHISCTNKVL
jgi:hypothetical protein